MNKGLSKTVRCFAICRANRKGSREPFNGTPFGVPFLYLIRPVSVILYTHFPAKAYDG